MKLYHQTSTAQRILDEGFRNGEGTLVVCFYDDPSNFPFEDLAWTVLAIDIPNEKASPFTDPVMAPGVYAIPEETANQFAVAIISDYLAQPGDTPSWIIESAKSLEESNPAAFAELAQRMRDHIPFLTKHRLLKPDPPADEANVKGFRRRRGWLKQRGKRPKE